MKRLKISPVKVNQDNPEWTQADFARAKQLSGLGKALQTKLRKVAVRGKQKAPTKQLVSLRLSPEVLIHYKSTGSGWQTRIDQTLRRAVLRAAR